ncbi:MAG: hypothetical protein WAL22_22075 [Solirubrobacteraceae bacterium]
MIDIDLRGFRVALVADELINGGGAGFDVLKALDEAGWGVMLLPPAWYPDAAAGPLLDAVADQVHEYDRHGYAVALIGERAGLDAALTRAGLTVPASLRPATASELRANLAAVASALAPSDAAAAQRGVSADPA